MYSVGSSVGIGTASPNISGFGNALTLKSPSGYTGFEMYGATSITGGQLDFGGGSQRYSTIVGEYSSSNNGQLLFRVLNNGIMQEVLRFTPRGSVGIGTSSPNISGFGRALTLKSSSGYVGFEMFGSTTTTGGQLDFGGGDTRYSTLVGEYSSVNNGQFVFRVLRNGQMFEGLRISSEGNVGVNVSNPQHKLHVNGSGYFNNNLILNTQSSGYLAVGDFSSGSPMNIPAGYKLVVQDGILTEKLKIALRSSTDWADYVFDNKYSLLPLLEVQEYINENHHLPNVPSAEEMAKNGLDVKETSKIFMEKIEELTLYIIQLNNEILELKKNRVKD